MAQDGTRQLSKSNMLPSIMLPFLFLFILFSYRCDARISDYNWCVRDDVRVISYFYPSIDYHWNNQNWKIILILLAILHSVTFIDDVWRWQEVGDCTNDRSTCKLTLHLAHLWSHGNAISEIFVPHYQFLLGEPSIVRWDFITTY